MYLKNVTRRSLNLATWCHKMSSQPVVYKFPDDKLVILAIDWAIFCDQGHSKAFTIGQAKVNPGALSNQMCGRPIVFPVLIWLFVPSCMLF